MRPATLLICTVGGTPEAITASIKGCQPERVIFVVSPETRQQVAVVILPVLAGDGKVLSPGQYELHEVSDAQDFAGCVEKMRELDSAAAAWFSRGEEYRVIADFTCGTKCMAAALALVAHRWSCRFSYVGGETRNKGGVGVVISGKESVIHTQNPWDSLGYQAVEEALVLFNMGDYRGAIHVLDMSLRRVERADLKSELLSLRLLAEAYLSWDLFDHKAARQKLTDVQRNANNLRHLLGKGGENLLKAVNMHMAFLMQCDRAVPGQQFVLDLLANAQRCSHRGRYDDGVARLYRAIEAIAQLRLRDSYGIEDTGKVSLQKIPESLRIQWSLSGQEKETDIGLQKAYQLLSTLGDNIGKRFLELRLANQGSPLSNRNQSILAHGFAPVGEKVFSQLWQKALALAETREEELPEFPKVGQ